MFKIQIVAFSAWLFFFFWPTNKYSLPLWDTARAVQFGVRAWICVLAHWGPGTWGALHGTGVPVRRV